MITFRASLLLIIPLAILSCAVPARHADEDQIQVQIVSADMFYFYSKAADGSVIHNQCIGRATEDILPMLEEAVLRGPRTTRHSLSFPWGGGRGGSSGQGGTWIRCRFDNGQNVDFRLFGGRVEGEGAFWMTLPEELEQALWAPSAWDMSYATQEPGPEIAANEWSGRNLTFEDITLDNSPVVGEEGGILKPVSAKRYSAQDCQCPMDDKMHQCELVLVGEANADVLLKLGSILYYPRGIMLKFFPDGSRSLPSWMEEAPSERIHCIMDNGREVILEYYAKPEAWRVQGEEGLRLAERWGSDELGKLLGSKGWESVGSRQ